MSPTGPTFLGSADFIECSVVQAGRGMGRWSTAAEHEETASAAMSGAGDVDVVSRTAVRFGLSPAQIEVLRLMFYDEGYRNREDLSAELDAQDAFLHYLAHGLPGGVSPGPFFDPEFCSAAMQLVRGNAQRSSGEPVVIEWLRDGLDQRISPTPFLDVDHYCSLYPEAAAPGINPIVHFLAHGRRGQRIPSRRISHLVQLIATYSGAVADPLWRVLSMLPPQAAAGRPKHTRRNRYWRLPLSLLPHWRSSETDREVIDFFLAFVQPQFYAAQLPAGTTLAPGQHAAHCLVEGLYLGLRPSVLFNADYCRAALAKLAGTIGDEQIAASETGNLAARERGKLFLLWLHCGLPQRIVPTPLFDEGYYLQCHPHLRWRRQWPFEYFVRSGLARNHRPHVLLRNAPGEKLAEIGGVVRDSKGMPETHSFGPDSDLRFTSGPELIVTSCTTKLSRLRQPSLQKLIAHAVSIEPSIRHASLHDGVIWPPLLHDAVPAARAGREMRKSLERKDYRALLLVAACATAKAARRILRYLDEVRNLVSPDSLLVVVTDGEYSERLSDHGMVVDVAHLTPVVAGLSHEFRTVVLMDLVRGLRVGAILNLDSRLGRRLSRAYGRQLGEMCAAHPSAAIDINWQCEAGVRCSPTSVNGRACTAAPAPAAGPQSDISAIVTAHAEGPIATASLRSYLDCIAEAERSGLRVQKLAVLDTPDDVTRALFDRFSAEHGIAVIETDFRDQGLARNAGVRHAAGATVSFLDGDDLWSRNWLTAAWALFTEYGPDTVVHPELCQYFGQSRKLLITTDQTDHAFDIEFLRFGNYYDALCLAARDAHLQFPYCERDIESGFAYEDWNWNCRTIEAGQVHRVARGTILFKRHRRWSQNIEAGNRNALVRPSALFSYDWHGYSVGDSAV